MGLYVGLRRLLTLGRTQGLEVRRRCLVRQLVEIIARASLYASGPG